MANNRMWLVHKPSGSAVFLGKRMGGSWYGTPEDLSERIAVLFSVTEGDDFALAMEDCAGAPHAFGGWQYTEFGKIPITQLGIIAPKEEGQHAN